MKRVISGPVAQDRFKALLLGGCAALAVILAAVGICGAMSHTVSRRTHEVGIGVVLGFATALGLTRTLSG